MSYPMPDGILLGDLVAVETFFYYDGPKLMGARSGRLGLFVGLLVEEDEDGGETWLWVRVSPERYEMLRSGRLPLAAALTSPEAPVVRVAVQWPASGVDTAGQWTIPGGALLPDAWLPDPSATLEGADGEWTS